MLNSGVCAENGIVGLNHGAGDLWGWVDGVFELRLFAVVYTETLHQERRETGTRATTIRVENQEALKASALVSQLAGAIKN